MTVDLGYTAGQLTYEERVMAAKHGPTATKILDAAEALFADHGYDDVSVRSITNLAGVQLNLLSYYFVTKEGLFSAVIDRRLEVLNQDRQEALAALAQQTDCPTVEEVLAAFIRPYFALAVRGDKGWVSYARMIAQICQSDRFSPMLETHMKETLDIFLDALSRALPHANRKDLTHGFYLTIALMIASFSGIGRIDALVEGNLTDDALDATYRPLLTYTTAGMLGLCGHRKVVDRTTRR